MSVLPFVLLLLSFAAVGVRCNVIPQESARTQVSKAYVVEVPFHPDSTYGHAEEQQKGEKVVIVLQGHNNQQQASRESVQQLQGDSQTQKAFSEDDSQKVIKDATYLVAQPLTTTNRDSNTVQSSDGRYGSSPVSAPAVSHEQRQKYETQAYINDDGFVSSAAPVGINGNAGSQNRQAEDHLRAPGGSKAGTGTYTVELKDTKPNKAKKIPLVLITIQNKKDSESSGSKVSAHSGSSTSLKSATGGDVSQNAKPPTPASQRDIVIGENNWTPTNFEGSAYRTVSAENIHNSLTSSNQPHTQQLVNTRLENSNRIPPQRTPPQNLRYASTVGGNRLSQTSSSAGAVSSRPGHDPAFGFGRDTARMVPVYRPGIQVPDPAVQTGQASPGGPQGSVRGAFPPHASVKGGEGSNAAAGQELAQQPVDATSTSAHNSASTKPLRNAQGHYRTGVPSSQGGVSNSRLKTVSRGGNRPWAAQSSPEPQPPTATGSSYPTSGNPRQAFSQNTQMRLMFFEKERNTEPGRDISASGSQEGGRQPATPGRAPSSALQNHNQQQILSPLSQVKLPTRTDFSVKGGRSGSEFGPSLSTQLNTPLQDGRQGSARPLRSNQRFQSQLPSIPTQGIKTTSSTSSFFQSGNGVSSQTQGQSSDRTSYQRQPAPARYEQQHLQQPIFTGPVEQQTLSRPVQGYSRALQDPNQQRNVVQQQTISSPGNIATKGGGNFVGQTIGSSSRSSPREPIASQTKTDQSQFNSVSSKDESGASKSRLESSPARRERTKEGDSDDGKTVPEALLLVLVSAKKQASDDQKTYDGDIFGQGSSPQIMQLLDPNTKDRLLLESLQEAIDSGYAEATFEDFIEAAKLTG